MTLLSEPIAITAYTAQAAAESACLVLALSHASANAADRQTANHAQMKWTTQ